MNLRQKSTKMAPGGATRRPLVVQTATVEERGATQVMLVKMTNPVKMTVVEREMERCGLAVMGIAEHGWLGQGRFSTARFSTADGAFMVNSETSRAVLGYNPVSERVSTLTDGRLWSTARHQGRSWDTTQ